MTSSTLQQAYNETEQDYDLKGSLNQQINSGNNNIVRQGAGLATEVGAGLALDTKTAPMLLGGPLGWIGYAGINFTGAAGANIAAQRIRGEEETNWGEVISSGLLGIIPFTSLRFGKQATNILGKSGSIKRAAIGGAGMGAGDRFIQSGINEGELPSPTDVAVGTALGGTFGAVFQKSLDEISNIIGKYQGKSIEEINSRLQPEEIVKASRHLSLLRNEILEAQRTGNTKNLQIAIGKYRKAQYERQVGRRVTDEEFISNTEELKNQLNDGIDDGVYNDIKQRRYKLSQQYDEQVLYELKLWGMEDGVFDIDKFFSQVRKQDGVDPVKNPNQGRRFIELFLNQEGLIENFEALKKDPGGEFQLFRARFVDMLRARDIPIADIQYHHIMGLYDSLPLYHGLKYGSDEWWDLTALLIARNMRPGSTGYKERTNFMNILGKAQQTGEVSKKTGLRSRKMPHGVAHFVYKDELGPQRHINTDKINKSTGKQSFWSTSELEAIRDNLDPITRKPLQGPYKDPETGGSYKTYREFKANKFADIVTYSEDVAIEGMKQWEALNPRGNMDYEELLAYLHTLNNEGKLSRLPQKYQVDEMSNMIDSINQAQLEIEHLPKASKEYKEELIRKLLALNLPDEFIRSYVRKVAPEGTMVSIDSIRNPKPRKRRPKKRYPKKEN